MRAEIFHGLLEFRAVRTLPILALVDNRHVRKLVANLAEKANDPDVNIDAAELRLHKILKKQIRAELQVNRLAHAAHGQDHSSHRPRVRLLFTPDLAIKGAHWKARVC